MHTGLYAALLLAIGGAHGQTRFEMRYLGEVGHLGGLDRRTSVNLGMAQVFAEPEGDLRLEGQDTAGKTWRVWIGPTGGIGGTDVWSADFDRNGRQDLLIAAYFPANGRCVDERRFTRSCLMIVAGQSRG